MNNYVFNPISGEVSARIRTDDVISAVNLIDQTGTGTGADINASKKPSSDTYGDFLPNADASVPNKQTNTRTRIKSAEERNESNIRGNESNIRGNESNSGKNESNIRGNESNIRGNESNSGKNESNGEENESNGEEAKDGGEHHDKAVTTKSGEKLIKTIVIAGQIEGHTQLPQGQKATRYEELIPQLVEIEENDEIGGLLIILNTVGGDVEAGLALSELIVGMKKPTASLVLGGGHSIGVPLAVSAKRSFIVPSATMTLHPVRITGMILGAPQTYVYLSRMQERIIDFTCSHCKMSPDRFNELMLSRDEMSTDLGSVLDGGQVVSEGLIDALGTLSDAIEFIKSCM